MSFPCISLNRSERNSPSMARTSCQTWEPFGNCLQTFHGSLVFAPQAECENHSGGVCCRPCEGELAFLALVLRFSNWKGISLIRPDTRRFYHYRYPLPQSIHHEPLVQVDCILGLSHSPPKPPLDTLIPPHQRKATVAALEFSPDDIHLVEADPRPAIYDIVEVHSPHTRLWSLSEGKGRSLDMPDLGRNAL